MKNCFQKKKRYRKIDFSKGSMLVYALIVMTCVLILLSSIIGFVVQNLRFSSNRVAREGAFQVAEAGIYYYRWYLAHATAGMNVQQLRAFWQNAGTIGVSGPEEIAYEDPETGDVIGHYLLSLTVPDPSSTIAIVTSKGTVESDPNVSRTVRARFRRPSWSEYAVLANEFIRFGEGTEVWGKIHSNGGIRFDGLAHNSVTSLVSGVDDPDHDESGVDKEEFGVHTHASSSHPPNPPNSTVNDSFRSAEAPPNSVPNRSDIFAGGRQFPVPNVSFTGVQSDLSSMKKTACNYVGSSCTVTNNCWASGCYFDNSGYGRHIVFNGTTMSVTTVNTYNMDSYDIKGRVTVQGNKSITSQSSATSYTIPVDGIIFVEDNVWLEGTVNGRRITVAAANLGTITLPASPEASIFLGANNLRYTSYTGQDIIGVVAQKNVEIMKASQSTLIVDAALLAQSGRVGREYYTCTEWKYETCTAWSHGSCSTWKDWSKVTPDDLSDDERHCKTSGTADHKTTITVNGSIATNERYGFAYTDGTGYTNRYLNFDNNLLYYPPPYFPSGTEYSIDLWEEL